MNTGYPDKMYVSGAEIHKMDYLDYLPQNTPILDRLKYGVNRASLFGKLQDPGYLHQLYREKDVGYLKYLNDFKDKFEKFDVIVMNPGVDLVHPEFLYMHFKSSIKILHFIDDPHMTYSYGLPFSWAFDGATYISPSFSEHMDMKTLLKLAGFKWSKWMPHCVTNLQSPYWTIDELSNQLDNRKEGAIYVGGYYKGKEDRLLKLKQGLGQSFDIFGRFPPHKSISFCTKSVLKNSQFYKVKALTEKERMMKYISYKVGINMHLSNPSIETGNARLYELPFHGIAQLADVSQHSLVENIYENEKEILLYRNTKECIDLAMTLLQDDKLRKSIALNGYNKTISHYTMPNVISDLIKFLKNLG